MLRCYIDGQNVPLPAGLDSLTLKKSRHRVYFGFMYKLLGYADIGSLTFTDPETISYLAHCYKQSGLTAQTRFVLHDEQMGVLYDGAINYDGHKYTPDSFSVSLRDEQAAVQLESQATVEYPIPLSSTLLLRGRRMETGGVLLTGDDAVIEKSVPGGSASQMHCGLPLKPQNDKEQGVAGTLISCNGQTQTVFYNNTTGDTVSLSLSGLISVVPRSSVPGGLIRYFLVADGVSGEERQFIGGLTAQSLSGAGETKTLLLQAVVSVRPGGSIGIEATSNYDMAAYRLAYGEINIVVSRQETLPDAPVRAVSIADAFSALISTLTGGAYRGVCTDTLLSEVYLTSGRALRTGEEGSLTLSLKSLFENASILRRLWLNVDTVSKQVTLAPRASLRKGQVSYIDNLTKFSSSPRLESVYNEVVVGFAAGGSSANNLLSGRELHTSRRYRTGAGTSRAMLNLSCQWVASSSAIEAQRRKAFQPAQASLSKADENDGLVYVLCRQGSGLLYAENIHEPATGYNYLFTPRRVLEAWRGELSGLGSLTLLESGTRQDAASRLRGEEDKVQENQTDIADLHPDFRADVWQIELPMTYGEYMSLGDWVLLADGRKGLLMDAEHHQTLEGPTGLLTLWAMPEIS